MNIHELTEKIINGRDLSKANHEKLIIQEIKDFAVNLLNTLKKPLLDVLDGGIDVIAREQTDKKMLKIDDVIKLCGLKNKQQIYKLQKESHFPQGQKLKENGHPKGYIEKEVETWISRNETLLNNMKIKARNCKAAKAPKAPKVEEEKEKLIDFGELSKEDLDRAVERAVNR